MEIHPIRNDQDHEAALREIDRLWNAEDGTEDADRLEILVLQVQNYEEKLYPVIRCTPLEILQFCMEQNDYTQADLARLLGSRSRASEILNGKRDLTLDQIRLLVREWRIPAGALIGDLERA